ncbi:hypothetical protein ZIOFF_058727 [Zingiber officinale]|uniref:Thioredoxin domain-containing protein n=1 Tax=Zingiber officinale TaxID=94328 RepID=A0A8J5F8D4_ZINOF|nr:hypothetical protein ZIOFF_058727 [Zingiber officinale]
MEKVPAHTPPTTRRGPPDPRSQPGRASLPAPSASAATTSASSVSALFRSPSADEITVISEPEIPKENVNLPLFPNRNVNRRIALASSLAAVGFFSSRRLAFGVSLKDLSANAMPYFKECQPTPHRPRAEVHQIHEVSQGARRCQPLRLPQPPPRPPPSPPFSGAPAPSDRPQSSLHRTPPRREVEDEITVISEPEIPKENVNLPLFPNRNVNRRIALASSLAAVGFFSSRRLAFGVSLKDLSANAMPYFKEGKVHKLVVGKHLASTLTIAMGSMPNVIVALMPITLLPMENPLSWSFYADWREICQELAPQIFQVEQQYRNKVNSVMLNVDNTKWEQELDEFGVEGIPHFTFSDKEGNEEAIFS